MRLEEMVLLVDIEKNNHDMLKFKGVDPHGNVIGVKSYMWTGLYDDQCREVYIGRRIVDVDELEFLYREKLQGDASGE